MRHIRKTHTRSVADSCYADRRAASLLGLLLSCAYRTPRPGISTRGPARASHRTRPRTWSRALRMQVELTGRHGGQDPREQGKIECSLVPCAAHDLLAEGARRIVRARRDAVCAVSQSEVRPRIVGAAIGPSALPLSDSGCAGGALAHLARPSGGMLTGFQRI